MTLPVRQHTHRTVPRGWRLLAAAALAAGTLAVPASAEPIAGDLSAAPVSVAQEQAPAVQEPVAPAAHDAPQAVAPGSHAGDPTHAGDPAHDAQPADAHRHEAPGHDAHGEEAHAASPWALIGRLFNFAILAGSLIYLLRSPFAAYLATRAKTIRADLTSAEETRAAAARQVTEIEARMRALPSEIHALTERGKQEIAAEEARIHSAAEAERQRMVDQARREIDLQLRGAERMLRRRAGELAVEVAATRTKQAIGRADEARLLERYLEGLGASRS